MPVPNPDHRREGSLLNAALELPADDRAAFLSRECGGEPDLRQRLEKLLRAFQEAAPYLECMVSPPRHSGVRGAVPSAPTGSLGDRIGRYKLLEKLGEGGFGVVWMAEQEEPVRRRVALKVLKAGMDTRSVIARFEAERQALALMDHPNIARVLDAGTVGSGPVAAEVGLDSPVGGGRPYFVMELVRGIRITDFCDLHKLSTAERLKLFLQVCHAVQHAHQKGVIHRDIKPSNILVTLHDGVPVPKVIDFGIAKATDQPLTDKTVFTQFQQFLGTPAYMSPEQAALSGLDIDTRSDIYSLGVLLYELLTGAPPFDSKTLIEAGFEEMRRIIREKDPPRPSARLSTLEGEALSSLAGLRQSEAPKLIHLLRGDLDWIAMKALEKDRKRRYETANGLAADIQRHLKNEPVVARPPSTAYRARKFASRNRSLVAAATAVFAALLLGAGISTWQAVNARSARQEALHNLYIANVNLLQQDYEHANLGRLLRTLEETRTYPGRGFEWYYWQRQVHRELKTLRGHRGWAYGAAVSPNGQLIATVASDDQTIVWDAATAKELVRFPYGGIGKLVSFSADSRRLATMGEDNGIRVLDVSTWMPVLELPGVGGAWPVALGLSPDGERVALGGWEGHLRVWEVGTGRLLFDVTNHSDVVCCLAYSRDGTRILTSSWDGTAQLCQADDGRPLTRFEQPGGWVWSAAFSPDERRIATAHFGDCSVRVWDVVTGQVLLRLKETASVWAAGFAPDGERIYSAGWDEDVKAWDARTGERLYSLPKGHLSGILSLAVWPDGRKLLTSSWDGEVKVWDVDTQDGPRTLTFRSWPSQYEQARFHEYLRGPMVFPGAGSDGALVLLPGPDNKIQVIDLGSGRPWCILEGHTERLGSAALSRDGQRIATGSWGNEAIVLVWNARTGEQLFALQGHTNGIKSVSFSVDGQRLASASGDLTVRIWNLSGRDAAPMILPHSRWPHTAEFSPNDRWIATSDDEQVRIWESRTGELVRTLRHGMVRCLAWTPDGRRLASASFDHHIQIWDPETGAGIAECKDHAPVWCVTFSPDGQRLLSGSSSGDAKLWEPRSGRELLTFKGHTASIISAGFSANGRQIMTGSEDQTVRIWEAASPEQVEHWRNEEQQDARRFASTASRSGRAPLQGTQ